MHQPNQFPPGQFPQGQPPYSQQPPLKVDAPSALGSLFMGFARGVRGLLSVPLAFFGGVFGSLVISGAVVFLVWYFEGSAAASPVAEEDEFELEFEPGALTKLGVEPKPDEIPVKPINEETRTPEETVKEAVTEEEKPPEQETEKKDTVEEPKDDKPVNKNDKAKISDKNRTDNNPYSNDLPNNIDPTGDPFGDPNGWSDMKKDGDPWATSVMSALNNMSIGAWAAKLPAHKPYQFKLKICKDGKVSQVIQKGSTGDPSIDSKIKSALENLKIPPPPSNIASKMKSSCVTLAYLFSWSAGKVK